MVKNAQKLSVYKSQLRVAITNFIKLQHSRSAEFSIMSKEVMQKLVAETSKILDRLEIVPTAKISQILQKKRRKRKKAKCRLKTLKHPTITKSSNKNISNEKVNERNMFPTYQKVDDSSAGSQKPHQRLRSYHDSNRFLRIFELLELLYETHTGDECTREISDKLRRLRSIWNVIRQENVLETTLYDNTRIQWNNVLFGVQEYSYYKQERSYKDMKATRQKWDSFVTQDINTGSKIPFGWVFPRENADPRWLCYGIQ